MANTRSTRKNVRGQEGCPKGYILRRGYTRKFRPEVKQEGYTVRRGTKLFTVVPKVGETYVGPTCIRDRGLPGRGPESGEGIGPLRKGLLLRYGYTYRLSDAQRRKALKKAVDAYGALSTYRKLNAVAKLSFRTAPDASKVFAMDRDWVRKHYPLKEQ
jgi:hypothetical protein